MLITACHVQHVRQDSMHIMHARQLGVCRRLRSETRPGVSPGVGFVTAALLLTPCSCQTQGLDFFGGLPVGSEDLAATMDWEATREDDRIVVLSDLWLDKPDTLDRLQIVLEGDFNFADIDSIKNGCSMLS